jgi:hypothetical protein
MERRSDLVRCQGWAGLRQYGHLAGLAACRYDTSDGFAAVDEFDRLAAIPAQSGAGFPDVIIIPASIVHECEVPPAARMKGRTLRKAN